MEMIREMELFEVTYVAKGTNLYYKVVSSDEDGECPYLIPCISKVKVYINENDRRVSTFTFCIMNHHRIKVLQKPRKLVIMCAL